MKRIKTKTIKTKKFDKRKLKIGLFSMVGLLSIPLLTLSFAFTRSDSIGSTYFTTYDNALDNSIALGIAPDFDTSNNDKTVNYANYLKPYTNDEMTKYDYIKIMDGSEVNRKAISDLDVNTIVLNEWMKAEESKFEGVVGNIAYTSMSDSNEASYLENFTEGGFTWKKSVNVNAAFMMQARDVDRIYQTGSYFTKKAQKIIDSQNNRIAKLTNDVAPTNSKTVGFVQLKANPFTQPDSVDFSFRAPSVYPFLYSETRGMGFDFPVPVEAGIINSTVYKQHSIDHSDKKELLRQFKNKFDYLVVMTPDVSNIAFSQVQNSILKSLLKSNEITEENTKFGTSGDYYTNAWGIIGVRDLLNKFSNWFGVTENASDIWSVPKKDSLKYIRHGEIWG